MTTQLRAEQTKFGGAWQDWTPAHTNITVGNGTVVAKYIQIGKTVHFRYKFILGSTSSIGSSSLITLPVEANSDYIAGASILGNAGLLELGVSLFVGFARLQSATQFRIVVSNNASSVVNVNQSMTATTPHTWAEDDEIHCEGTYEAA